MIDANNTQAVYKVTGRYLDGSSVLGYHLVGSDGSEHYETRDRVIFLIERGLIINMRTVPSPEAITEEEKRHNRVIRGKGINLNTLPVFNLSEYKKKIAENNAKANIKTEHIGKILLLKQLMFNKKCIGYQVQSYDGKVQTISYDKALTLARDKALDHVISKKERNVDTGEVSYKLLGEGWDIKSLPILVVDKRGKVLDPSKDKNKLAVRAAKMKRSGVVRDLSSRNEVAFRPGDFIICITGGDLRVLKEAEVRSLYKPDKTTRAAICDDYLGGLNKYSLEIFGSKPMVLSGNIVTRWDLLTPSSDEEN